MSELPLDVTELLKAVCPCISTFTLCRSSLFNLACYTLYTGQSNTVIKEKTTSIRCSLQKSGGFGAFVCLFVLRTAKIQAMCVFTATVSPTDEQEQDASFPLPACCYISAVSESTP